MREMKLDPAAGLGKTAGVAAGHSQGILGSWQRGEISMQRRRRLDIAHVVYANAHCCVCVSIPPQPYRPPEVCSVIVLVDTFNRRGRGNIEGKTEKQAHR
ncbi:hypothetical protein AOLI_G00213620 [Acnodon oligacanthus]